MADDYRELTRSTTTPIHTGEQIYLRQNFRELIEKRAVSILGTDPVVKGGLIDVWDKPGLGIEIDTKAARKYLAEEDSKFFD